MIAFGLSVCEAAIVDHVILGATASGALVGPEGAGAGLAAGLAFDLGFSSYLSPLGAAENVLSIVGLVATGVADVASGYTCVDPATGELYIGRDTLVSVRNNVAGHIPEANVDALISGSQFNYDVQRRNGALPGASIPLNKPLDVVEQLLIKNWW